MAKHNRQATERSIRPVSRSRRGGARQSAPPAGRMRSYGRARTLCAVLCLLLGMACLGTGCGPILTAVPDASGTTAADGGATTSAAASGMISGTDPATITTAGPPGATGAAKALLAEGLTCVAWQAADDARLTAAEADATAGILSSRLEATGAAHLPVGYNSGTRQFFTMIDGADEAMARELGRRNRVAFHLGAEKEHAGNNADGSPLHRPVGDLVLDSVDIAQANAEMQTDYSGGEPRPVIVITFTEAGRAAFAAATEQQAKTAGTISVWLDNELISAPTVNEEITDGIAVITLNSYEDAATLARNINDGALPLDLASTLVAPVGPSSDSRGWDGPVDGPLHLYAAFYAGADRPDREQQRMHILASLESDALFAYWITDAAVVALSDRPIVHLRDGLDGLLSAEDRRNRLYALLIVR